MVRRMQALGVRPRKVWAFANGEQLSARTPYAPGGRVEWSWHTAPTLRVRHQGAVYDVVIDPSLFNGPVTVAQWRAALKRSPRSPEPFVCLTRVGEPPLQPNGTRAAGTGYWPQADPPGGLDAHALATMRRYKPLEPRPLVRSR
jgi:hypothetical protein